MQYRVVSGVSMVIAFFCFVGGGGVKITKSLILIA